MEAITPYLTFNGQAADALAFYTNAFKGEVLHVQTFGASEMGIEVAEDWKDKIIHAAFQAGQLRFMVSDTQRADQEMTAGDQLSLAINFTSEKEIDDCFKELSKEGSKVIMPLEKTFWGAKFAMVVDPFGISWMLNFDYTTGEAHENEEAEK